MTIIQMLWLADVVSAAQGFFMVLSIIAAIVGALGFFAHVEHEADSLKSAAAYGVICLLFGFVASVIPSKNTIYVMISVKYGQELAQNPKVKDISEKVLKVLDKELDKLDKNK